MDWIHYLNEMTLAGQVARLEKRNAGMARRMRRGRRSRRTTIKTLEEDLGRMALLLRSVTELGLEKGAFTDDELARKLEQVDFADGILDGGLDLDVVMPGEEKLADLQPLPVIRKKKRRKKR